MVAANVSPMNIDAVQTELPAITIIWVVVTRDKGEALARFLFQ